MRKYTGMVELSYANLHGNLTGKFVMAFHNTAKELKIMWLSAVPASDIKIIPCEGCEIEDARKKSYTVINTKVNRLLEALAITMKDENPALVEAVHEVINDHKGGDGYNFDFISAVESAKCRVRGSSY